MQAVLVVAPEAEGLQLAEVPDASPAPGEVLIRVHATAVNRADIMQRRGLYPPPAGTSEILGLEAAGEVVQVPPGTSTELSVGDRVICLVGGGAYAELLAVAASNCIPIPDSMSWADAAAIPEVFITAFQALVRLGRLTHGDVALVHSIASGVGTAAAQIAYVLGARCIGTSRTPERAVAGGAWGAQALVVDGPGFGARVRDMTDGHGADVVLDLVGAKYLADNVACLARGGRIVLTGLVGGRRAELDMGTLLAAQGMIIGSTLRGRSTEEKAMIMAEFAAWAMPLFAAGTLTPVVDSVIPLRDAAQAHAHVEANRAVGKVVLLVGD